MYQITQTNQYLKDIKTCKKRGYKMELLKDVLILLSKSGALPQKYKPHKLSGNYSGYWECHIKPDWLLIWKMKPGKIVSLARTGNHSDLF